MELTTFSSADVLMMFELRKKSKGKNISLWVHPIFLLIEEMNECNMMILKLKFSPMKFGQHYKMSVCWTMLGAAPLALCLQKERTNHVELNGPEQWLVV